MILKKKKNHPKSIDIPQLCDSSFKLILTNENVNVCLKKKRLKSPFLIKCLCLGWQTVNVVYDEVEWQRSLGVVTVHDFEQFGPRRWARGKAQHLLRDALQHLHKYYSVEFLQREWL